VLRNQELLPPATIANRLLAGLPSADRRRLLQSCDRVPLSRGTVLCQAGEILRHVYFPASGCLALVATEEGRGALEMGLIGHEGMLGATLVLGIEQAPLRAIVQGSGHAWRTTTAQLRIELARSPALRAALKRYLYVVMSQLSQSAGCNRFHEVEPRLARWLLMTHDRAQADHFHLTHAVLAERLGVRRSAVTIAAGALQQRALIRYSRGELSIVDRDGLEAVACKCYAALQRSYAQQLA